MARFWADFLGLVSFLSWTTDHTALAGGFEIPLLVPVSSAQPGLLRGLGRWDELVPGGIILDCVWFGGLMGRVCLRREMSVGGFGAWGGIRW